MTNNGQNIVLLNKEEVLKKTGYKSHVSIYSRIKTGDFPRPIKIGARTNRWIETEVDAWVQSKIAARCS